MAEGWRNRIVATDIRPAASFLANPQNWRIHPQEQQAALSGSLATVGWVQDVIVNLRSDPSWGPDRGVETLIDGHLRVSLALRAGDETQIPVKFVDLTPSEENVVLVSFDPIAALAVADKEQLDALLRETKPADAALQQFLSELAAKEGITSPDFQPVSIDEQGRLDEKTKVTCPNCQFEFSLSKA